VAQPGISRGQAQQRSVAPWPSGRKRLRPSPRRKRLEYLAALARATDPNVIAIILYGSVARGVADEQSGVDLVILVADEQAYSSSGSPNSGVRLLIQTYDHVPWPSLSIAWAFSPFVDMVDGHYLTEDLIANIQRDGVLVYRRSDGTLPT
jgi:hypothetical protein